MGRTITIRFGKDAESQALAGEMIRAMRGGDSTMGAKNEKAEPAKRRPRSKEERAAALLREAKVDKAIKSARLQLDVVRRKLYERDFDGAVEMARMLFEQLQAELPFSAKADSEDGSAANGG